MIRTNTAIHSSFCYVLSYAPQAMRSTFPLPRIYINKCLLKNLCFSIERVTALATCSRYIYIYIYILYILIITPFQNVVHTCLLFVFLIDI